jgi:glycosyltransferase involved in cell wall biosynthesis
VQYTEWKINKIKIDIINIYQFSLMPKYIKTDHFTRIIHMDHVHNTDDILQALRQSYKMNQDDLVSVILPTYNRYNSLVVAINSIKKQSYKNIEIIVINDASTQVEYKNLQEQFNDIKVINLEKNMRQQYNTKAAQGLTRNLGINFAKGKYIAFLDDDDFWFPEKIQIQLYFMKKYNFRVSSTNFMNGNGPFDYKMLLKCKKALHYNKESLSTLDHNLYTVSKNKIEYTQTSTVMIEKSLLDEVGLFRLVDEEDWDLWRRIFDKTDFLYIDIMLMYYDQEHGGGQNYQYGNNRDGKKTN